MGSSPIQGLTATAVVEEGSIVAGAATNAVLYVNSAGQLATEAAFGYNDTTNTCTVDILTVGVGPLTVTAGGVTITAGGLTLSAGVILAPDGTAAAPSYAFASATGVGFAYAAGHVSLYVGSSNRAWVVGPSAFTINDAYTYTWDSGDLHLTREAAAVLQLGKDVNGAAVAQTLKAHDGITGTDVAGANLTLAGGRGTGAGAVGNLLLATSTLLASGTTAQTLTTRVTITGTTITTTLPILYADGSVTAPSMSFSSDTDTGFYLLPGYVRCAYGGTNIWGASATLFFVNGSLSVGGATDVLLERDAAAVLALRNGTTSQTSRVYQTTTNNVRLELQGNDGGGLCRMLTNWDAGSGVGLALGAGGSHQTFSTNGSVSFTSGTGAATNFTYTGPASSGLTASTEAIGTNWNASATRTFATGALTLQREFLIQAPTYAFVGASTLTDAVTFAVSGPPIAGANATLTRRWIATFGTLEATVTVPNVGGVGIFGAGATQLVVRDTTNNSEGVFEASAAGFGIGAATSHALLLFTNNATRLTISADGTAWTIATATLFSLPSACNLTIGAAAIASGTNVCQALTGTAPSSQTADTVSFYSSDISAGNTEPSFYCEGTAVLATGQADSASSVRVKMRINGTEVTVLCI